VVIDVVVTDGHGRPVSDLKKEDFAIKENGKEQTIKSFEAHAPVTQPQGVPKFQLPPNTYTNVPQQTPDSSVSIVLFDLVNTPMIDQSFAREQMLQFLKTLPAGRRVALFVLGSRLRMISGFTTDSNQLLAAAKKVVPLSSHLLDTEDDKQREEDRITEMSQGAPDQTLFNSMRDFLANEQDFRTNERVSSTLTALEALARGVSGYPGRKNLLWLSEGFPVNLGPNLESNNPLSSVRTNMPAFRETSGLLSSAQVAVYPIDIGGLKTTGVSAGRSGISTTGFRNGRSRYGSMLSAQSLSMEAAHQGMEGIAKETGGKAYYNTNDLKGAMASSIERGTTYYSVAYTPEDRNWDSKYRRVEVKLDRSGLKAEYRKGYFATPDSSNPEQDSAQRLVAVMQPGMPDATMLFFGAQVLPLKPGEESANIKCVVSARHIVFSEGADHRKHAKIEVVAVAWDHDDKSANSVSQTLDLALPPEAYQRVLRDGIHAQMQLPLKPGDYRLRLGIMDDGNGKVGTIELPFQVASSAPASK
jgi:VWFA-related protein